MLLCELYYDDVEDQNIPQFPALRRHRQVEICEFKFNSDYSDCLSQKHQILLLLATATTATATTATTAAAATNTITSTITNNNKVVLGFVMCYDYHNNACVRSYSP